MDNNQQAVLAPLIYSDLFSFPLTEAEVWQYLGPTTKLSREDLKDVLLSLSSVVSQKHGYYYLSGRERIVTRRMRGEKEMVKKREIGQKFAKLLGTIPTIRFIGFSGSVASGSAAPADDIDFFIITKKNTLFTTRLLVLFLLEISGARRRRNDTNEKNKLCVNFLIDESMLAFSDDRHDLYTAREIAQLIPLFDRNQTYRKFLLKNQWMKAILPHTVRKKAFMSTKKPSDVGKLCEIILTLPFIEFLAARWQLGMITKHRTNETVTNEFLAFHPRDYRHKTMQKFSRKCISYESFFDKNYLKTNLDYVDKGINIFYTA